MTLNVMILLSKKIKLVKVVIYFFIKKNITNRQKRVVFFHAIYYHRHDDSYKTRTTFNLLFFFNVNDKRKWKKKKKKRKRYDCKEKIIWLMWIFEREKKTGRTSVLPAFVSIRCFCWREPFSLNSSRCFLLHEYKIHYGKKFFLIFILNIYSYKS